MIRKSNANRPRRRDLWSTLHDTDSAPGAHDIACRTPNGGAMTFAMLTLGRNNTRLCESPEADQARYIARYHNR